MGKRNHRDASNLAARLRLFLINRSRLASNKRPQIWLHYDLWMVMNVKREVDIRSNSSLGGEKGAMGNTKKGPANVALSPNLTKHTMIDKCNASLH